MTLQSKAHKRKAATTYEVTVLHAEEGKRLAKLYTDPTRPPDDYDGGLYFTASEVVCDSFEEFVASLGSITPDTCIIRGAVRDDARERVNAGRVRRLAYEKEGCPPSFEPRARNWIVLDADGTKAPFDASDVDGSVRAWHATLPDELRAAESAFFLSAKTHLSSTVRGKLLVALAEPLDNASAASYAAAHKETYGFDQSICHTVSPNYFANPVFEGCDDPLAGKRAPIVFHGVPARLPALAASQRKRTKLRNAEPVPDDIPDATDRVVELAATIADRWLEGDRVETHAWLHLCGWALDKGWSKSELASLLVLIDGDEADASKRAEHWHILGNAKTIEGPGGARSWLGDDFAAVDALLNTKSPAEIKRMACIEASAAARQAKRDNFAPATDNTGESDGLVWGTLSDNPPRQSFLVPELEIGVGRPYGWVGKTNASKTLTLMQLEVDLALGRPVFGQFAGPGKPVPVLRVAYEGFSKAPEDYLRLLRGTGERLDFAELATRLQFAEGRRHFDLTDKTREWLLRVTAPFGGGVCVIDPLVAACRGLDENSTEIAQPIYDLESVSKANGVAFIVAHHFGHGADRSRGSSAIDGAFGASASVAKVDGNGQQNHRTVKCAKQNRYGFHSFELVIRDTTEKGKPWLPTAEAIRNRESSWAVSVETGLRLAKADPKAEKHLARVNALADGLEGLVRDAGPGGLGATPARTALKISGDIMGEVLAEAKKRGRVRQKQNYSNGTGAVVLEWLEPAPVPASTRRLPNKFRGAAK